MSKIFIQTIFFSAVVYSSVAFAQGQQINLERITQPKVEKFLNKCKLSCADDLNGIQPLCSIKSDSSFKFVTKSFIVDAPLELVWQGYQKINPEKAWSGNKASFGFLYNKNKKEISYHRDEFRGMELGQMIFINLHLLGGWFNIAVGHEVTEINNENQYIRLCYLENGASQGSQFIYFKDAGNGQTEIIHDTYYKSKSEFRDRRLYPVLHDMYIKEYHDNMAELIKIGKDELLVSESAQL